MGPHPASLLLSTSHASDDYEDTDDDDPFNPQVQPRSEGGGLGSVPQGLREEAVTWTPGCEGRGLWVHRTSQIYTSFPSLFHVILAGIQTFCTVAVVHLMPSSLPALSPTTFLGELPGDSLVHTGFAFPYSTWFAIVLGGLYTRAV
jgi:hypothetical protein